METWKVFSEINISLELQVVKKHGYTFIRIVVEIDVRLYVAVQ